VFFSFPTGGIAFCYGHFSYSCKLFWRYCILIDVVDIVDIVHRPILKFPSRFSDLTWTPRSTDREAVSFIPYRVYFLSPFYLKPEIYPFSEMSWDFYPDMKDGMCKSVRSLLPSS